MPSEVILPRVDMDMATGKISKWFVESGAPVIKGQPLFEIETDKAAMEIEAPASGTIRDLASASGADIPVGSIVAWIYKDGESSQSSAAPEPLKKPEPMRHTAEASRSNGALLSDVQGHGTRLVATSSADPDRPRATPIARRLARERGLDLATLAGSGPRGRIQARDVNDASHNESQISSQSGESASPQGRSNESVTTDGLGSLESRLRGDKATAGDGGKLNLVRLREGQGTPTLLLHGFGADANTWRPFLSGRQSAHPVYALDLPGHGLSPSSGIKSFADLVDLVEEALRKADLPAFDLVGHSLGGGVAAALAARGSIDIRSLLLLSPAGLGPEVNGDFVRGFLAATSEKSLGPWIHELVSDPDVISPAFIKSTLKAREGTGLVEAQRHIAETVFPDGTQAFGIRSDIAKLAMPVRIVFGIADKIIPAKHAAGLPGTVAVHLFPNVGHMPQFEVREAVAAILAQMTR